MIFSTILGVICGAFWGITLCNRYRFLSRSCNQQRKSGIFGRVGLGPTIQFLLMAAIVGLLFMKYSISLWWWFASFIVSFWVFVILMTNRFSTK